MVIKKCVICGKEFDARNSAITCSKECSKENTRQYKRQYYQDNEHYRQDRRQYYQDNKEYIQQRHRQYYQDNKESFQQRSKKYYQDNKKAYQQRNKKYYQDNKEHLKQYARHYRQDNKDKCRQYNAQKKKREVNKLIKQYDGDLEKILENIPSGWHLREAQMRVWFDESYYDGIMAKIESTPRCEITGETDDLEIHHLYSFNTHPKLGNKVTNMVRVAKWIHILFHKEYGYGDNTLEQWEEFMDKHNFSYI